MKESICLCKQALARSQHSTEQLQDPRAISCFRNSLKPSKETVLPKQTATNKIDKDELGGGELRQELFMLFDTALTLIFIKAFSLDLSVSGTKTVIRSYQTA